MTVPSHATGAPNGVSRIPFGRWFRYAAGFSDATLHAAMEAAQVPTGGLLVDCFAGSGTTGVECMKNGTPFIGIEGNPLVAEFAALKLIRPLADPDSIRERARTLLHRSRTANEVSIEEEHPLIKRCYSVESLRHLVALRNQLDSNHDPVDHYMRCALAAILRETARVRTGWPYQLPSQPRRDRVPPVHDRFWARCEAIAADVGLWQPKWSPGRIITGDSRTSSVWEAVPDDGIAGCVTSPPYLNNYDYVDATRLEFYFFGEASSWSDLLAIARQNLVTAATHHTTVAASQSAHKELQSYTAFDQIDALVVALREAQSLRRRPKEYDRMLTCYLADIGRVLTHLQTRLRSGCRAVLIVGDSAPYGVYVDTPGLIASIASDIGLDLIDDTFVRPRGGRWQTNGSRHQIPLSERQVVLRAG